MMLYLIYQIKRGDKMKVTILPKGEEIDLDENRILTKENVISDMELELKGRVIDYDTLMILSCYMEFAISTGDLTVMQSVHDKTDSFIMDFYHVLDNYRK